MITKEDIKSAIKDYLYNEKEFHDVRCPVEYEFLKKEHPEWVSEVGKEGESEYMIYCGKKIYKWRPITNN